MAMFAIGATGPNNHIRLSRGIRTMDDSFWYYTFLLGQVHTQVGRTVTVANTSATSFMLDTTSPEVAAMLEQYNKGGGIPFINFANQYMISGASYSADVLADKTRNEIAGDLTDPSSDVTQGVVGAANVLTATICKTTGNMPCIMPQRLALTDANKQVTEMVGSGPYRFVAAERLRQRLEVGAGERIGIGAAATEPVGREQLLAHQVRRQPAIRAICPTALPTAPAAPDTNTVSPAFG